MQTAHIITGPVNWYGLWTLYLKEVRRFLKVPAQTVVAPAATALWLTCHRMLSSGYKLKP